LGWRSSSASCYGALYQRYRGTLPHQPVHLLLGTANLIFWQIFVAIDNLPVRYIWTSLHWLFVVLQVGAAIMCRNDEAKVSGVPLR